MPLPRAKVRTLALSLGLDLGTARTGFRGLRDFSATKREFMAQAGHSGHEFDMGADYPCLADRYLPAGSAGGHYFHQDLYVAQTLLRDNPDKHVDVGSRIDGFVAHVATLREIHVIDVRPLTTSAKNIIFRQCDIMNVPDDLRRSTDSLSCLHALEHFGLGRYGDAVDYYGYLKGWHGLKELLRPGGVLYFSVPMARQQRIEFNAHRIFNLPYLRQLIEPDYRITDFAYVDDDGDLVTGASWVGADAERSFNLVHGCAIFRLVKSA